MWLLSNYLTQCRNIINLVLRVKIQWYIKRNSYISIRENAFESVVCKMVVILSRSHMFRYSGRHRKAHAPKWTQGGGPTDSEYRLCVSAMYDCIKMKHAVIPHRTHEHNTWLHINASTHLPMEKLGAISQKYFPDAFWGTKSHVFWLKFHWSLFLRVRLTITQH